MLEILAPAGGTESLRAALNTGADAVYLGLNDFSARRNAQNFTVEELNKAAEYCRLSGVRLYLALNTLVYDDEIIQIRKIAQIAADAGVDAFIVQDLGVCEILKETVPHVKIHASTQMTVTSVKGAEAAYKLGFSRAVLARELSLNEIEEIARNVDIETEVFVHGALCVCLSGQCYMSAFLGGGSRSANRGLCAQPCRLNFKADETEYALSLKDLSVVDKIKELEQAGVKSLKIEGRMKRPEYVAAAVNACYRARSGIDAYGEQAEILRAAFSRGGFTQGYLTGERRSMQGFRGREDVLMTESVLKDLRELYKEPFKRRTLNISLIAKVGEEIICTAECPPQAEIEAIHLEFKFPPAEKAETRETTAGQIIRQLSKLGGTVFSAGEIRCEIDRELSLSAARVNEIRRYAVEEISWIFTQKSPCLTTTIL